MVCGLYLPPSSTGGKNKACTNGFVPLIAFLWFLEVEKNADSQCFVYTDAQKLLRSKDTAFFLLNFYIFTSNFIALWSKNMGRTISI